MRIARVQDVGTNLIDGHCQPVEQTRTRPQVQDVGTNLIDGHMMWMWLSYSILRCKTSAPT